MMHEKAAIRYRERARQFAERRNHPDPGRAERAQRHLDWWLDQYADGLLRATEWDANQWGFHSDKWMEAERAEMAKRGGADWPSEII